MSQWLSPTHVEIIYIKLMLRQFHFTFDESGMWGLLRSPCCRKICDWYRPLIMVQQRSMKLDSASYYLGLAPKYLDFHRVIFSWSKGQFVLHQS